MTYNEACKKLYPNACAILLKLGIQWGLDDSAAKLRAGLMEDDGAFLDAVELFIKFKRMVDGFVRIHGRNIYGNLIRFDDVQSLRAGMDLFRLRIERRGRSFVFRNIREGNQIAFLRTAEDSCSYWIVFSKRDELVTSEIFASAYCTVVNVREGGV